MYSQSSFTILRIDKVFKIRRIDEHVKMQLSYIRVIVRLSKNTASDPCTLSKKNGLYHRYRQTLCIIDKKHCSQPRRNAAYISNYNLWQTDLSHI